MLKVHLPAEGDLEAIPDFDFIGKCWWFRMSLRGKPNFKMRRGELPNQQLTLRYRSKKKSGRHAEAIALLDGSLDSFLESARSYLQLVSDGVLPQSVSQSGLAKWLACFDSCRVLSTERAATCFVSLFQNFSDRGWVPRKNRTIKVEEKQHFVDHVRLAYLDRDTAGPKTDGLIALFSGFPQLHRETKTLTVDQLCCLCLVHVVLKLPEVNFWPSSGVGDGPDVSENTKEFQTYLLCSSRHGNKSNDAASITKF